MSEPKRVEYAAAIELLRNEAAELDERSRNESEAADTCGNTHPRAAMHYRSAAIETLRHFVTMRAAIAALEEHAALVELARRYDAYRQMCDRQSRALPADEWDRLVDRSQGMLEACEHPLVQRAIARTR